MQSEEFEFIEGKIEELKKRYNDYMEADKNVLAKKTYNTLHKYRKILDLMIDGQMYKDLKEQKKKER